MSDHAVLGALVAARDYLRQQENDGPIYGFYPGGDPRSFSPDEESCTPGELAAHREACAAWERGERPEHVAYHHTVDCVAETVIIASHAGTFGLGIYVPRDEDAEDVLEQLDAAIASLGERTT